MAEATYVKDYRDTVHEKLFKSGDYKNANAVPGLDKIVVSVGIGTFMQNNKDYSQIEQNLMDFISH